MPAGAPGWFGKVRCIFKFFREKRCDLTEGSELWSRHGLENHLVAVLFDQNLVSIETEGFWQANCLAAAVLEDFSSAHSYIM